MFIISIYIPNRKTQAPFEDFPRFFPPSLFRRPDGKRDAPSRDPPDASPLIGETVLFSKKRHARLDFSGNGCIVYFTVFYVVA